MRVAVIGLPGLIDDIAPYIPDGTSAIISGGTGDIYALAERWADTHRIPKLIFQPRYMRPGKSASLRCSELIVDAADAVVAICRADSHLTRYTVRYAERQGKRCDVYMFE